jgi:hypothetical protein
MHSGIKKKGTNGNGNDRPRLRQLHHRERRHTEDVGVVLPRERIAVVEQQRPREDADRATHHQVRRREARGLRQICSAGGCAAADGLLRDALAAQELREVEVPAVRPLDLHHLDGVVREEVQNSELPHISVRLGRVVPHGEEPQHLAIQPQELT